MSIFDRVATLKLSQLKRAPLELDFKRAKCQKSPFSRGLIKLMITQNYPKIHQDKMNVFTNCQGTANFERQFSFFKVHS